MKSFLAQTLFTPWLVTLALLAVAPATGAHAFLQRAQPDAGSTVRPPAELKLWFSGDLEPAFSRVEVRNAAGERVDDGRAELDGGQASLLRLSLPPLPAGSYTVTWRVLSVDSHVSTGDFSFRVE